MLKLLIEYFSWPITIAVFTVIAILIFKRPIAEVIRRGGVKIGKEGFSIDQASAATAASGQSSAIPADAALELDCQQKEKISQLKQAGVSSTICDQEARIRNELVNLNLTKNVEEALNVLVRHLAIYQLFHAAERTYRLIFGSQIAVLRHLNLFGPTGSEHVRTFYLSTKQNNPQVYDNYSYDSYLNFMISFRLIEQVGQENYRITQLGRDFLQWMIVEGVSDIKAF